MKGKRFVWVGVSILFAGCAGNVPVVSPATLTPLILARTAMVELIQDEMLSCESADAPLVIREVLPGEVDPEAELTLRWGEPDELPEFVYVVGEDLLLAVVHEQNPLSLTVEDVRAIYAGQVHDWAALGGEPGEIEVWMLMGHNEAAGLFKTYVMGDLPITSNALLSPTAIDAMNQVLDNEQAIGLTSLRLATRHGVPIDLGVVQPILAISDEPLSLAAQNWVACMQADN